MVYLSLLRFPHHGNGFLGEENLCKFLYSNEFSYFQVLGSTLLEVDLDRILQSIHEYFEELGMAEIRKRQVIQKHLSASIHSKCFSSVHYDTSYIC